MVLLIAVSIFLKNLPPAPLPQFFTNPIGMEFELIPAGSFQMGSPDNEAMRDTCEDTQHWVTFSQPFYMGKYEVTREEWEKVMGVNNNSKLEDKRLPMAGVTWEHCQSFLQTLKEKTKNDGYTYRLPSEAEWEYACRAGTTTPFSFGENITTDQVNYNRTQPYDSPPTGENCGTATSVGSFPANAWCLHDMHGNVREWCQDWYHPNYNSNDRPTDGRAWEGGTDNPLRVMRGGWWDGCARDCRSASRYKHNKSNPHLSYGFRVVAEKTSAPWYFPWK
ncbi:MAG: formylglycine-generating enzyme family protein [Acidobacteria bacterium]|nr:formylglycine-generating enzyme family protein [Acidobacteriota bacterium]